MNKFANDWIDALDGTVAVAEIFDIEPSAVSQWRHTGIPHARMIFMRVAPKCRAIVKQVEAAQANE